MGSGGEPVDVCFCVWASGQSSTRPVCLLRLGRLASPCARASVCLGVSQLRPGSRPAPIPKRSRGDDEDAVAKGGGTHNASRRSKNLGGQSRHSCLQKQQATLGQFCLPFGKPAGKDAQTDKTPSSVRCNARSKKRRKEEPGAKRNRCEARKEDKADAVAAKPNHDADLAALPLQTPRAPSRHLQASALVWCLANWPEMPWFSAYVPVRSWCPPRHGSRHGREKLLASPAAKTNLLRYSGIKRGARSSSVCLAC